MAKPPAVSLDWECVHSQQASALQDHDVGDPVLPPDVEQTPKAAEMLLSGIGGPRFTAT